MVKLYHYTDKSNLNSIMHEGLTPVSKYEKFSQLREGVVFCWLSPEDQKIYNDIDNVVCLEVEVDEERCTVADMDFISMAMMYKFGGKKYGGKNIPVNPMVADLFVKIYEATAKSFEDFEKEQFFTPEVLVKGTIAPKYISVLKM